MTKQDVIDALVAGKLQPFDAWKACIKLGMSPLDACKAVIQGNKEFVKRVNDN